RPHPLRDAAREESDRGQGENCHRQRQQQDRKLGGFEVAPQIAQRKTHDLHQFTLWPASSSRIRLQRPANARSWVTRTRVLPWLRFRSNKRSTMRWPVAVSRFPVG